MERGRTLTGLRVGRLGLDAEALAELPPTIAVPVGLAMGAVAWMAWGPPWAQRQGPPRIDLLPRAQFVQVYHPVNSSGAACLMG